MNPRPKHEQSEGLLTNAESSRHAAAEPSQGVALFDSTQGAIRAERLLISHSVAHKLISAPRHLSANCGFCLRFAWQDRELVEQALRECSASIRAI